MESSRPSTSRDTSESWAVARPSGHSRRPRARPYRLRQRRRSLNPAVPSSPSRTRQAPSVFTGEQAAALAMMGGSDVSDFGASDSEEEMFCETGEGDVEMAGSESECDCESGQCLHRSIRPE